MITRKDFGGVAARMVVQNKVFKQVKEVFFFANAAQHGFKRNAACVRFVQTLPFMEKLIFAAERADLCLHTVGEDKKRVVIKQLRNGVLIIGVVIGISILHVNVIAFQLDKQQRNTVDKADDIGYA